MSGLLPSMISQSTITNAQAALLANLQATYTAVQSCSALQNSAANSGVNSQSSAYLQEFTTFYNAATAFCQQSPGWFGLGTMMDQLESYQNQLYGWQQILRQAGCTAVVLNNPNVPNPTVSSVLSILQWGTYAVVTAAAAYGIGKIVEVIVPLEQVSVGASKAREHLNRSSRAARRHMRRFS
jgi:hypothetical protein